MQWRTLSVVFLVAFALALATLQFDRIAGDDAPRAAAVESTRTGPEALPPPRYGATVELQRDMDGHFRADVLLNGRRVRMLVDSGASFIVIDEALARQLGIAPPDSAYTGRALTANGEVEFAPVRLASVRIGDVERVDIPAGAMRGSALSTPLLGQSFLGTLSEVTISGDTMKLK